MTEDRVQAQAEVGKTLAHLKEVFEDVERRLRKAERSARLLSAMHAISQRMSRADDPGSVMSDALDTILPLLEVELGAVHVGQPGGEVLLLAAYRGIPAEAARGMNLVKRGEGQVGLVAEKGESRLATGLDQLSGPLVRVAQEAGMKTLVLVPLKAQDLTMGVLSLGSSKRDGVSDEEMLLLESVGAAFGIALESSRLYQEEQRQRAVATSLARSMEEDKVRLKKAYTGIASLVADTLVRRHPYLRGHPGRVASYAARIASRLALSERDQAALEQAGSSFDLGLIATPDEGVRQLDPVVLEKEEGIRQHPVISEDMVRHLGFAEEALSLIRHHHERMDGQGYPNGLVGEAIPLGARIMAVADTWDRLTMDWPHRAGLQRGEASAILQKRSGVHYDPRVVAAFLSIAEGT